MAIQNKSRKTAPWTSQGNDIMQTLSRYYSNTFSDQEKQHTINLFLGLFIPEESKPPIWEFLTDYYLHHRPASKYIKKSKILSQWWDRNVLKCLPYALHEATKTCAEIIQVKDTQEEMIDVYYDYYRPYELSLLAEVYGYQVSHSVRDFMPHFTTNFSPFAVRVRPGRRREEAGNKNTNIKNPSLTGQSSTNSTASSASSSVTSSDDEESQHIIDSEITVSRNSTEKISFGILFPSMKEVYGIQPACPKRSNLFVYKRFVKTGKNATHRSDCTKMYFKAYDQTSVLDNKKHFKILSISNDSFSIYEQYVKRGKYGGSMPNPSDMNLYERYAHQQQLYLGILHPDLR